MFYDLETRQEKIVNDRTKMHEPNLCVFKQACEICYQSEIKICTKCGVRLQTLLGEKVIEGFLYHLLTMRIKFKKTIVIAHNGSSFDHQFILNYILTRTSFTPSIIMRGSKIITMDLDSIRFLDSINYFPMALSKLPQTFGLQNEFKKGYFPHLFNTVENESYVGPFPDISYYNPNTLKNDDRERFLEWYDKHKDDIFDMKKELTEYCISDVEILSRACLKFRQQVLETGNICPFTEACTIASTCNKLFRRNFLKPDTIGIIPKNGYRFCDKQSRIALKWLLWEEKQRGINIIHAAKQKEVIIKGLKVDGYCRETNQVFEFHGCYFHGHTKCLRFNRNEPLYDSPCETLNTRYESTVVKIERLQYFGYEVIQMWECDFRGSMTKEIEAFTDTHPLTAYTPLNPRDSFYGGRTGNTKTYYKARSGEKIKYIDVCSLYPWVCKNGKYPVGHPEVFIGDNCPQDISQLDGLIKCKILPPQNLFHPVLPTRLNNKLYFALCRTCSILMHTGECFHTIEERSFVGTWVIDEVKKALEKGYKIIEVYEIWKYNVEQYNPETRVGGLFTEMMNKFIQIKQQASGWPKDCITQDQREQYIEEFLINEGIHLKYSEIVENPGLRALAKLILNSFWGKFGQRENQAKTKIINKPDEFFTMFCNPSLQVNAVIPANEDVIIVNYEYIEECYDILPTINVCLASFTTAQARLKLYSYLEKLSDRVLYYDTDSVIYISRSDEYDQPTGKCVGDMTDELESYGTGSFITEFTCAGPKSYAFRVYSPLVEKYYDVCKVKGITLNYETSRIINFDKIKKMILYREPSVYVAYQSFDRTDYHEVVVRDKEKVFNAVSRKRKFEDCNSVPYGFKNQ